MTNTANSNERRHELILEFTSNGDEVKVGRWIGGRPGKPLFLLDADTLRKRTNRVRAALRELTFCIRDNPTFDEAKDPSWRRYGQTMYELQEAGEGLQNAIFDGGSNSESLVEAISALGRDGELRIQCSDADVTLPFGFIYDGTPALRNERPCREHFRNFWVSRFRLTVLINNGGCMTPGDLVLDPGSFKALYALHQDEFEKAVEDLDPEDQVKLQQLLELPERQVGDWSEAKERWDSLNIPANIFFILGHSDGDLLKLKNSTLDSGSFMKRFRRPEDGPATLLMLNCCLSATGARGTSLLSAIARPGFSGLVGTEAEILNTHGLRCGTRLMWDICAAGLPLGEAIDKLQQDDTPGVFPTNLYYSCYADRTFVLKSPIPSLTRDHDVRRSCA